MLFKFGYIFEANINPGVRKNIYKADDTMKGWDEKLIEKMTAAEIQAVEKKAAEQLDQWRREAIGKQFNHYIRLSVEVAY